MSLKVKFIATTNPSKRKAFANLEPEGIKIVLSLNIPYRVLRRNQQSRKYMQPPFHCIQYILRSSKTQGQGLVSGCIFVVLLVRNYRILSFVVWPPNQLVLKLGIVNPFITSFTIEKPCRIILHFLQHQTIFLLDFQYKQNEYNISVWKKTSPWLAILKETFR